ncbi:hypothetical protein PRK78_000739 [Emydomyces testavorans]|uniref:Uncharacterized protein n=1 Tax=Emydomyces testavorans TaxID=2070801 RepID=A0AAF0DC18_9EURO|nr:hypothetical protein PRK78_000739 [Emydomyces testavorans]
MFQKSVSDAVLCLRCQTYSQLSLRPLAFATLPQSSRRYFNATDSSGQAESQKDRISKIPTRKTGFPGRIEPLNIDTLGGPSHVLVLRDKNTQSEKRFERLVEKEDEDRLRSPSEVLEEVDKERYRLVGATEVSANFEYLRSLHKPGDRLFPVTWDKLRDVLEHGFTLSQLSQYIKQYRANSEANSGVSPVEDTAPSDKRPKWKAGTSLFLELGPEVQRNASIRIERLRQMQGKVLLAETVMRDCWQLAMRNEVGQVDLRVSSKYLSTLLLSKSNPLKTVAESHNVKIDVTKALNLIRITGNEPDSLHAYAAVEELVSRIHPMEVDLSKHGSIFQNEKDKEAEKNLIQALQAENGVYCRIIKSPKRFVCYYLDGTKSNAEKVCRSVCLAASLPLNRPKGLFTYFPDDQPANLYSVITKDFTSFQDRNRKWFRWAKPLLDADLQDGRAARRPPANIYSKDPAAPLSRISNSLFCDPEPIYGYNGTDTFNRAVVTATIGKCLFQKNAGFRADEITFSKIEDLFPKRTFIQDVPNTWSFLKTLSLVDTDVAIHRIRLFPGPRNDANLPFIELEMEVPQTAESHQFAMSPIFRRATVILSERDVDMLLPETALDLRFTKTIHYDLLEGSKLSLASENHPVQSALAKCVAQLQYSQPVSGPQPDMPLFCKLVIPKKLITAASAPFHQKSTAEETLEPSTQQEDFIEGDYVFPPLQSFIASRIARFRYKDLELGFSNPRTGPLLPRQSINVSLSVGRYDDELRPLIGPKASGSSLSAEEEGDKKSLEAMFQPLYTRACQLAFELSANKKDCWTEKA